MLEFIHNDPLDEIWKKLNLHLSIFRFLIYDICADNSVNLLVKWIPIGSEKELPSKFALKT